MTQFCEAYYRMHQDAENPMGWGSGLLKLLGFNALDMQSDRIN